MNFLSLGVSERKQDLRKWMLTNQQITSSVKVLFELFLLLLSKNFWHFIFFRCSYTHIRLAAREKNERGLQEKDKRSSYKKKKFLNRLKIRILRVLEVRIETFFGLSSFCFFNCSSYHHFSRNGLSWKRKEKLCQL